MKTTRTKSIYRGAPLIVTRSLMIQQFYFFFREQAKFCAQAKSCEQVSRFGFWETGVWIWFWETGVRKQVSDFFGGKQVSGNRCLDMAPGNRCWETGVLIPVGNRCQETGVWIWFQETGVGKQVSCFLVETGVGKQVSCFLLETGVGKQVSGNRCLDSLWKQVSGKQVSGFNCHWALNVRKQMSKYPMSHVLLERKCRDTSVRITLVWVTGDTHPFRRF